MKLQNLDPAGLKKNPWNSNYVSPDNERKIEESMKLLGTFKPIVVRELPDGSHEILGGEHRATIAARIGMETIPAIVLANISDIDAKRISLADNARYGIDDTVALRNLLDSIGSPKDIEEFLPFTGEQLESIFQSSQIDLAALDINDDELLDALDKNATPSAPKKIATHQTMKFRVRIADVHIVEALIKRVMREQGFTEDASEVNAGDALIWVFQNAEIGAQA